MLADRRYFENKFQPGDWESLLHKQLQVQVAQLRNKKRKGMGMMPPESTAAALMLLLDEASRQALERMGHVEDAMAALEAGKAELQAGAERVAELTGKVASLEAEVEKLRAAAAKAPKEPEAKPEPKKKSSAKKS